MSNIDLEVNKIANKSDLRKEVSFKTSLTYVKLN